jgi:hypothetical protein
MQVDQLFCEHPHIGGSPTNVYPQVAALPPTQFGKPLREPRQLALSRRIGFVEYRQHTDPPHAVALLRPCHYRPRRRAC